MNIRAMARGTTPQQMNKLDNKNNEVKSKKQDEEKNQVGNNIRNRANNFDRFEKSSSYDKETNETEDNDIVDDLIENESLEEDEVEEFIPNKEYIHLTDNEEFMEYWRTLKMKSVSEDDALDGLENPDNSEEFEQAIPDEEIEQFIPDEEIEQIISALHMEETESTLTAEELEKIIKNNIIKILNDDNFKADAIEQPELLNMINGEEEKYSVLLFDISGEYTGTYDKNSSETTFPTFERESFPSYTESANDQSWLDNYIATNMDTRAGITDAVHKIFAENSIEVPDGLALYFSVDPYDYNIHVTFSKDDSDDESLSEWLTPEMEKKIEDALNKGDNGKNLYRHSAYAYLSSEVLPSPSISASYSSFSPGNVKWLYSFVEKYTGYDIREMESIDGKLVTPNGEDLWVLTRENYIEAESDYSNEGELLDYTSGLHMMSYMKSVYEQIVDRGWDSLQHGNQSIIYKNGDLYDANNYKGFGPGQTDWIEESEKKMEEVMNLHEIKRTKDAIYVYEEKERILRAWAEFEREHTIEIDLDAPSQNSLTIDSIKNLETILDMILKNGGTIVDVQNMITDLLESLKVDNTQTETKERTYTYTEEFIQNVLAGNGDDKINERLNNFIPSRFYGYLDDLDIDVHSMTEEERMQHKEAYIDALTDESLLNQ